MESRRPSHLSLPYGKIAMWGIAVSVVATGAFLALAPCSPLAMASRVLDGGGELRGELRTYGRHLPMAAEVSRRAVAEVLGQVPPGEHRWAHRHEWLHVGPELGVELSRVWSGVAPELGVELSGAWTKIAPELREEMRRELRRELRGLRFEVDASPPAVWVDGG